MKRDRLKDPGAGNDLTDNSFTERIKCVFKGETIGKEIIFFNSVTSTNEIAMKIAGECDDPEGIVVFSDSQTEGRGRMGRSWVSPPNVNLYFTLILKPSFSPVEAPLLTLMAAVAVASAIREFTGLNAKIKWPNDLLVNGGKTGGILLEMKTDNDKIEFIAIGIGINVNMETESLPKDIQAVSTSLFKEYGRTIDRVKLFGKILAEIEDWYKTILTGGRASLLDKWRLLSSTTGKNVSVQIHDKVISGIAEDINDRGALIIKLPSGKREVVSAGDVTILKDQK